MTIKEFQNEIARIVGEIPEIAQASCVPVAESDGDIVEKINTQIDGLGLSCLVMTPDLNPHADSDMIEVRRLVVAFTETPLMNRPRQGSVTALEAACLALAMFRKDFRETVLPLRITQRSAQDGSVITADLESQTSFELTTKNEGMTHEKNSN